MKAQRQPKCQRCMSLAVFLVATAFLMPAVVGEPAEDPNEIRWDLAERSEFVWESVEASAKIIKPKKSTANPDEIWRSWRDSFPSFWEPVETSAGVAQPLAWEDANSPRRERSISVLGEIHILDTNDLVGMHVSDPCVFQVVDSDGKNVRWEPRLSYHTRQYQEPRYISALSVDLQTGTPMPVWQLQPYDASVSFSLDPNQPQVFSLSSLECYVHALYAEDVIALDIPFEASAQWLDVSSGFQIRVWKAGVWKAESEPCSYVEYSTGVRHDSGAVQGLNDRLGFGETVADYLVVKTRLLDAQGEVLPAGREDIHPLFWSDWAEGTPLGTANCGGILACAVPAEVASIRHVIAVHPSEAKIPFVLTDISVPSFHPTAGK